MFDIAKYLEKFKVISQSREFLINSAAETIKNICGIDVEKKKILFKDGVIRINENPAVKTTIFLKKQKILDELNKKVKGKIRDLL